MTEVGTYVYAITRDEGHPRPAGLTGVAGTPVRMIERAGLVAYVSTVPLDRFGAEQLRRSLEDLDWLGGTARAHHHVVETVAKAVPTAPVRLVTVYNGEEQVGELLERRHDDFVAVLSHVAGRREWGVKAYVEPVARQATEQAAEQVTGATEQVTGQATEQVAGQVAGQATGQVTAPSPAAGPAGETDTPGTAYLKRRQASLHSRRENRRHAVAQAEHVHAALSDVAVASMCHRPQDPELSGRAEWMVLNGAYLVDDDRAGEFTAALDAFRGQGLDLELTGPWAPYSFTTVDFGTAGPEGPDDAV
ncbi:GvpL/GvpF family gas vesicle protein [Streptosporangium sp. NPDC051022]|uniref:GvpL/GvpF family gas vesicle protein n=1 Tax=Streptosporangium sp. NPDC051022 TaxID=3155752 RepID=UPI00342B9B4F